jgi:lipopolysaccharide transport system permease protein
LLLWNFFANVLTQSADSLQANGGLISKVYCPRLLFPFRTIITGLVDIAVGVLLLGAMMVYYGVSPGWAIFGLPLFLMMAAGMGLAAGLWASALSVRNRDVRFMLPAVLQMWFFASPVVYDVATLIPPSLRPFYNLNPMGGILEGFRWSLLGTATFSWSMLVASGPTLLVLLVSGLYYFRRLEQTIADHL